MENSYYELEKKRRRICWAKQFLKVDGFVGMRYAGGRLHSAKQGNYWIKNAILSGKPFMAGRFGATEMTPVIMRECNLGSEKERAEADRHICIDSGFFPCDSYAIDRYKKVLLESIPSMDLMGIYFFINNEEYMINKYMNKPYCVLPICLEPFYFKP